MVELTPSIINGFVQSCLRAGFDGQLETPPFHKELWEYICKKDRFVAISAPRGHAKSTAGTITCTLAYTLFRKKKHVLIISNTEEQACTFVQEIANILRTNEKVADLFELYKNDKNEVVFDIDSVSEIVVRFKDGQRFRIIAKGSNQRMRGMLWEGTRPDLVFCDDLEDDEICMNSDRREKFRNWFMNAMLPAISSSGIVRIVGTVLHMDALLERLMPVERDKNTVIDGIRMYSKGKTAGRWISIKFKAHTEDFSEILWPEKFSKQELIEIRESYIAQGNPAGYSQEYLNVPIDESRAHFKRRDFLALRKEDLSKNCNFYIAADLAISEKERADYSVFVIGGVDPEGILQIRKVVRDRMDGMEIVNTILALQKTYRPLAFGIESTQISKAIGPFLREQMVKQSVYPNIVELIPHKTDKITRSYSFQARLRAGAVKFDKEAEWYYDYENELCRFPRD